MFSLKNQVSESLRGKNKERDWELHQSVSLLKKKPEKWEKVRPELQSDNTEIVLFPCPHPECRLPLNQLQDKVDFVWCPEYSGASHLSKVREGGENQRGKIMPK